jgi:putative Holliday junction resolvase
MRYLAIDLGDKRTGLALGDAFTRIATPLEVLEIPITSNQGSDLEAALVRTIDEHLGPRGELVLGLPLNMDDTEGPRAKLVRAFAQRLRARTGREIYFVDERLSSADADWSMARSGMTRGEKKRKRDALAAAAILRDFLAAGNQGINPAPSGPPSDPLDHSST